MVQDIAAKIAGLDGMSTGELAERYRELHGQPCRTRHRAYLIRKIAWCIHAHHQPPCPQGILLAFHNAQLEYLMALFFVIAASPW